jgi:N6-L-threonylcarbamoyladenine synthase
MLILGLETSCDETAAAIVRDGRHTLASVIASQHDLHAEYGGVVPELASRAHAERILPIVRAALTQARVTLADIDAIAVGHRPGLIGSLLVGVGAAKALAWSLAKPLIPIDHVHAHLYAGELREGPRAQFPAIGLVVSGGHTSLYRLDDWTRVTRLGSTIDDAMGEAFDKAATILGLPYPGGPNLDRLAQTPGADDRAHEFPIARLAPDSLDFSFSGLKTSLLYAVRGKPLPGGHFERDHTWLSAASKADFAASFQRAAVQAVAIKLRRAIERVAASGVAPRTLLVGGGVTANSRLRPELTAIAARHGLSLSLPAMDVCVDNAAMIAGLAFELRQPDGAPPALHLDLQAVPTTSC